jgi:hypothetical protein
MTWLALAAAVLVVWTVVGLGAALALVAAMSKRVPAEREQVVGALAFFRSDAAATLGNARQLMN